MPPEETGARRILALWCPDWPAMAASAEADLPPLHPVAVLSANRVVACSASARAAGVRRGMRKRQAQAACTEM
ncbi:Y-family DNA polymerase, partial [Escherichia coli]